MNVVRIACTASVAFAILAYASARAQGRGPGGGPQGAIVGTILDGESSGPLGGATVTVRSAVDSSIVTGAIAERDGSVSITGLQPGKYFARVSFVGYVPTVVSDLEILPGRPSASIGTIRLAADASVQQDITITAKREFMTGAIDRTVYKTSDLKVAAGGNTSDLLRNIPSVEVDADGNVSVRGSQNVAVQINGRPTMMTGAALAAFLRSLPADAVERVEVVPNPSAKYDPDGLSGILNIVLKENTDRGLSGGINGAIGTDPNATFGAFLGYGSGAWNIYANYGLSYERMMGYNVRVRENQSLVSGQPPRLDNTMYDTSYTLAHTGNVSVDYTLGGGHALNYTGFLNVRGVPGNGRTDYVERSTEQAVTRRYMRGSDDNRDGLGLEQRLGYKWTLEPMKHELSAEVRYAFNDDSSGTGYLTRDITEGGTPVAGTDYRNRISEHDKSTEFSGQVDYTMPIGESGQLEAGFKADVEKLDNSYRAEVLDTATGIYTDITNASNQFTFDRKINAAYVTYSQDFGPFGAQVGLRAENQTSTFTLKNTGASFNNDFSSLFPSAFLSYAPFEGLQLKASYSRRITRPVAEQLNPFPQYQDQTFRMEGNPKLKPEYIDSYDFNASYYFDQGSITVNPFFRRQHDLIGRWELFDTLGASVLTYENFNSTDNIGADVIAMYRVGDWLNAFVATSFFEFELNGSNVESNLSQKATVWSTRANLSATVAEGLDVQLTYIYRAPMDIVGGTIDAFSTADLAIVKKVFGNRGTIGLRVSDPLKQMGFKVERTYGGFYQLFDRTWNSRTLNLTFSYTFGSPVRQPRRQSGQQGGQSVSPVGM